MNKLLSALVVGTLGSLLILTALFNPAWAAPEKFELKLASEYADKHPTVVNGFMPWIKRVQEASNGRLVIQFFNPNTLCPAKEVYASTVAGAVDMGASPTHWVHGKFPLSEAAQLPFIFNGAEAGSLATWELYKQFPEWRDEYKEIKPLWQWTSALIQLHTKKKLVRTLEDLQGMKIIVWNPQLSGIVKALGGNPVEGKPQDTYLALERGLADGVVCPIAPMRSFKITEAAKYHTIANIMVDVFWAGMNRGKWNSLPPDLQKILDETTGDKMAQISGKALDEGSINDAKWMKDQGHSFYVLPPAEKNRWREKVQNVDDEWLKKMDAKGYKTAKKIYETAVNLGKEHSAKTVGGYKE
jgi:TRAP-type C4-dicarboxylate transport system substrate-binding protein